MKTPKLICNIAVTPLQYSNQADHWLLSAKQGLLAQFIGANP
jgi:hypothetical protein